MTDILMAVYNGEKYLSCQTESILSQSDTDWHLYICDDASDDNSPETAGGFAKKHPDRITFYKNDIPTGSACGNFMNMLKNSSGDYVMFCDQDDLWLPDKIRLTREKMAEMEQRYGSIPILVHTELEIADSELNVTSPSFMGFQGLDPRCRSLNRLLCQNNVTGCTVMMNRALCDIVCMGDPSQMLMHDWWAALCAAAFGQIGFVDIPTIRYRQHGANQLGAVNNRNIGGIKRAVARSDEMKARITRTYDQAAEFMKVYGGMLDEKAKAAVTEYMSLADRNKAARIYTILKKKYLKQNFMSAAGQIVFC